MRTVLMPAVALCGSALADWSPAGRQDERSSTSRTDTSVHFSLLPGEDPLHAALDCLKATRAAHRNVTWGSCTAYTPGGFALLSSRVRPCYSVGAQWFADEGGRVRLYVAADDRQYPISCPAVKSP